MGHARRIFIVVIFLVVVPRIGDGGEFVIVVLVMLFLSVVIFVAGAGARRGALTAAGWTLFRALLRSVATAATAAPTGTFAFAGFGGGVFLVAFGVVERFADSVEIVLVVAVGAIASRFALFVARFTVAVTTATAAATAATATRAIAFLGGRGFGFGFIDELRIVFSAFDGLEVVIGRRRRNLLIVSFISFVAPAGTATAGLFTSPRRTRRARRWRRREAAPFEQGVERIASRFARQGVVAQLGGELVGEVGVVFVAVIDVDDLGFDDLFERRFQRLDAGEARFELAGVGS